MTKKITIGTVFVVLLISGGLFWLNRSSLDSNKNQLNDVHYFVNGTSGHTSILRLNGEPVAKSGWETTGKYVTPFVKNGRNTGKMVIEMTDFFGESLYGRMLSVQFGLYDKYGWGIGVKAKQVISKIQLKEAKKERYKKTFSFHADIPQEQRWRKGDDLTKVNKNEAKKKILKKYQELIEILKEKRWNKLKQFGVSAWEEPEPQIVGFDAKRADKVRGKIFEKLSKIEDYNVHVTPTDKIEFHFGKRLILVTKKLQEDSTPYLLFAGKKGGRTSEGPGRFAHVRRSILCFLEDGNIKVIDRKLPLSRSNLGEFLEEINEQLPG